MVSWLHTEVYDWESHEILIFHVIFNVSFDLRWWHLLPREAYFTFYNVTRPSEKLGFQKNKTKKKRDFAWYCRENTCFWYNQRLLEKKIISKHCWTSENYAKIMIQYAFVVFFLFAIADPKNFNWCNVIQQIKNPCRTRDQNMYIKHQVLSRIKFA